MYFRRPTMSRSLIVFAFLSIGSLVGAGCSDPCVELSRKICRCEPTEATQQACLRRVDAEAANHDPSEAQANRWLVPTVAIQETGSGEQVTVIRNGQPVLLTVTAGETQGEWTIVTGTALQAGDQVVGSTASFLGDGLPEEFSGPGGAPGPFGRGG